MPTGTLKMWNADRGFGFIGDDAGGPDVFLHVSALQSAGIDPDDIRKGERLTFDIESGGLLPKLLPIGAAVLSQKDISEEMAPGWAPLGSLLG